LIDSALRRHDGRHPDLPIGSTEIQTSRVMRRKCQSS
jgi:hypothetical protein